MAGTKELKKRIDSVRNTRKITNAMYLISSTKLQRAKAELDATRPYFKLMETEIRRIFESRPDTDSIYFYPKTGRKPAETYAYLVITADKGLAGAYNHNVLKTAEAEMNRHKDVKLYVVGEYGRQYFMRHGIPIERSFLYTAQNPTLRRAREICAILLEEYEQQNVDEIRIIFSDLESSIQADVQIAKVLPFERTQFKKGQKVFDKDSDVSLLSEPVKKKAAVTGAAKEIEEISSKSLEGISFFPSVEAVLNSVIRSYITGYVYGALVDSFCSEQNARMTAMDSANNNAGELLEDLQVQYNRVRQAQITQEITEVTAGAKAQRLKREREAKKHGKR